MFSDKLGGYEAKVNPELWGNIASKIGAGTTAAGAGMALTTKIIIALSVASIITVASFIAFNSGNEEEENKAVSQLEVVKKPVLTKDVDNTIVTQPILKKAVIVTPISQPSLERLIIIQAPIGPVLAPTPKLVVTPRERVVMQANPIHNVFKPQEEKVREDVAKAIVDIDPVLKKTRTEDIITEESTKIKVVFPNVFTPNNDGTNDLLFISNPEELDHNGFVLQIVDASFKTVFTSTNPSFEWNGNDLGGEPAKNGQYIAIITSKDKNGNEAKPVMYQFEIRK